MLGHILEYTNWVSRELTNTRVNQNDERLDRQPKPAGFGSIRRLLAHEIRSQGHYLNILRSQPEDERKAAFALRDAQGLLRESEQTQLKLWRGDF